MRMTLISGDVEARIRVYASCVNTRVTRILALEEYATYVDTRITWIREWRVLRENKNTGRREDVKTQGT